jgi:hypothetical protein
MRHQLRLLFFSAALAPTLAFSASAAAQTGPSLQFSDEDELVVTLPGKGKSTTASVVVENQTGESIQLEFAVLLEDEDGDATNSIGVAPSDGATLDPHQTGRFELTFSAAESTGELSGELVARAMEAGPAVRALRLKESAGLASWFNGVIFVPLIFAALFICARWALLDVKEAKLTHRLGPANWDFSGSWASTLTVLGALAGTILSAGVLPEETERLTKASYTALNLIFGILIVFAPVVYAATRRPKETTLRPGDPDDEGKDIQYQGFVWSFLVASGLTIWAVVGEMATIGLLLAELHGEKSISTEALYVLWGVLGAAALVVLHYSWNTIRWMIELKSSRPAAKKRRAHKLKKEGRATGSVARIEPDLAPVPML